ncbi:MAG: DUF6017 domain-containing protein [Christensenellales bacterium]|jgi:hypothetical protein
MTYDYFYGQQAEQFSFYRIPKALFTDEAFGSISTDAKLLYGILLDRMNLSAKNGWLDKEGRVYIIFTLDEVQDSLGCGHGKAAKLLDELDGDTGLIERKRQGLGKPNLIFVKNFISRVRKSNFLKSEKRTSGSSQIGVQEIPIADGSNTDFKKTDPIDTDSYLFISSEPSRTETKRSDAAQREIYRSIIKENIDYDIIRFDRKTSQDILEEIVELMVDVVCSNAPYIRVLREEKPTEVVKSQFLKLNSEHIRFVMDCLEENTTKVKNMRQYLISTLYNAPLTIGNYYRSLVNHDMYGDKG